MPTRQQLSPKEEALKHKMELLQKVRILREGLLLHRGKIDEGDPSKEYCWVNHRDDRQYYFQAAGWVLVTNDTGPNVRTKWRKPDGTHVRGDVILYQIDKEMFEAMQLLSVLEGQDRIAGVKDSFMTTLEKDGVPLYEPRV